MVRKKAMNSRLIHGRETNSQFLSLLLFGMTRFSDVSITINNEYGYFMTSFFKLVWVSFRWFYQSTVFPKTQFKKFTRTVDSGHQDST